MDGRGQPDPSGLPPHLLHFYRQPLPNLSAQPLPTLPHTPPPPSGYAQPPYPFYTTGPSSFGPTPPPALPSTSKGSPAAPAAPSALAGLQSMAHSLHPASPCAKASVPSPATPQPLSQPQAPSHTPPQPTALPPPVHPPPLPHAQLAHQPPPADVLDEALASLGAGNLSALADFNMDDLDDNLIRDAFFGPSSSAADGEAGRGGGVEQTFHSILEYDPASLPSTSAHPPPAQPLEDLSDKAGPSQTSVQAPTPSAAAAADPQTTPKLREKAKIRKEKELADLDKAFEWHLSKVVERERKEQPVPDQPSPLHAPLPAKMPPMPSIGLPFLPNPEPSEHPSAKSVHSDEERQGSASPVRFSPVHFSPANSPGPSTSTTLPSLPANAAAGSAATTETPAAKEAENEIKVFIVPEKKSKVGQKAKVPIWKQGVSKLGVSGIRPPVAREAERHEEDEFDFTDDDEPKAGSDIAGSLVDHLNERKLDEEVSRKLAHISHLHPELKMSGALQKEGHVAKTLARQIKAQRQALEGPRRRGRRPKEDGDVSRLAGKSDEDPEALLAQLSEVMSRRKAQRELNSFCSTAVAADNSTAASDGSSPSQLALAASAALRSPSSLPIADPQPPADSERKPNIIIRIPKALIKNYPPPALEEDSDDWDSKQRKRRRKGRKNKDDPDYAPVGVRRKTADEKGERRKLRERRATATVDDDEPLAEDDNIFARILKAEPAPPQAQEKEVEVVPVAPMKIRLKMGGMGSVAEAPRGPAASLGRSAEVEEAAASERLAQFQQPEGSVAKGTFLVAKEDIGKEDCPLWKVDNQNLLQKFTASQRGGSMVYKSCSTYSGWAAAHSDQYMSVAVRVVEAGRGSSVVEPETPLVDLFPAVSTELRDEEGEAAGELLLGHTRSPPECDQHQAEAAAHPLSPALHHYVQALLLHCLTGNFLQTLSSAKDPELVGSVAEVEAGTAKAKAAIASAAKWSPELRELLVSYPLCTAADTAPDAYSGGTGLGCQACGAAAPLTSVQLFVDHFYDAETLESRPPRGSGDGPSDGQPSPLPALEKLVCGPCAADLLAFHRLSHLRFHLYKRCEEKVEALRDLEPALQPLALLDRCLQDKAWLSDTQAHILQAWAPVHATKAPTSPKPHPHPALA